jgi:hypothetical protein
VLQALVAITNLRVINTVEIIVTVFVAFYLFIGIMVYLGRRDMYWIVLRETYPCTFKQFKNVSKQNGVRFVYAANDSWSSSDYISTKIDNNYLYLCGDTYFTFWGWLNPPIKIPLQKLTYCGEKLYWFKKRDVVEINLDNVSLKYALPKEFDIQIAIGKF